MANPTIALVEALRLTAKKLDNGAYHSWGHHGACNCGNLVQVITKFTEGEILRYAHEGIGEWTELAQEFCPITNAPITLVIKKLEEVGLTPTDIHHVEYLNDKEVLKNLDGGFRWLKRNKREDAIAYFNAFANMLENKLLATIHIDIKSLQVVNKIQEPMAELV